MSFSALRPSARLWLTLALSLLAGALAAMAWSLLNPVPVYAGTITIIDGDVAPNTVTGIYTDGWLQTQLASDNYTVDTAGVGSGPDDILVQDGAVITWTNGSRLTLLAQNHIVISGTLQHDGPGNGAGGLRLLADADQSGGGDVRLGSGLQSSGIAAGSRHGLTRVDAANLILLGSSNHFLTYAMLGFTVEGQTPPFTISGAISVTVSNAITATGGGANSAFAQIGHGGGDMSSHSSSDCVITGSIDVNAGGDIAFQGGGTYSYAQLGHGGFLSEGDYGGDHTLIAGGDVSFRGGDSATDYSQFGNGGHSVNGNHSGSHTLRASAGSVTFQGGSGSGDYAQFGNGGQEATGNHSGSHILSVPSGSVTFQGGEGSGDYAQMGNGGYSADATSGGGHGGSHHLTSGGVVTFAAGPGNYAYAQLGNGGYGAFCLPGINNGHSGNHTLDAKGNVLFRGGAGNNAYAQLGNGGFDADGSHGGSHNLVAAGDVTFQGVLASIDWDGYAHMGNGGGKVDGDGSGDLSVRVGATAVFSDAIVGHVSADGLPSITQGSTIIGVSQLDPYATGAGKLIANGVTSFTSASAADGGELRFYLPRQDSQQIPTTVSFNGEHFAADNTIPPAALRGFHLFGEGPYEPEYSFYMGGLPDVGILKMVESSGDLELGDPITYTLTFSSSGSNTAIGVRISDTLPAALAGVSVSAALEPGVSVTQTGSAPNLAWQVGDLGVGKGGVITLKATVKNELGLLGTSFGNTAVISATSDITTSNNVSTATSQVIAPAAIVVTKTVVGPEPVTQWGFSGSGDIGSFSLPATGGSTTLNPLKPGIAYTLEETLKPQYAVTVSCTDGGSGAATVTVNPAAGQTVGCTFTNTYVSQPVTQTITVNKVVVGGALRPQDCSLYIDGRSVISGVPAQLAAGAHSVSEDAIPNYVASFSGDCNAGGVVNLGAGQHALCIVTNTYAEPAATGGVSGRVFEDINGSGEQDKGEPGVASVLVTLSDEMQAAISDRMLYEATDTTDVDGGYGFEDVPAGTYTLALTPPAQFAAPAAVRVTVTEGQVIGVPPVALLRGDPSAHEAIRLPGLFRQ